MIALFSQSPSYYITMIRVRLCGIHVLVCATCHHRARNNCASSECGWMVGLSGRSPANSINTHYIYYLYRYKKQMLLTDTRATNIEVIPPVRAYIMRSPSHVATSQFSHPPPTPPPRGMRSGHHDHARQASDNDCEQGLGPRKPAFGSTGGLPSDPSSRPSNCFETGPGKFRNILSGYYAGGRRQCLCSDGQGRSIYRAHLQ